MAATGPAAAQNPATPWITTREPITLFSANDGDTHLRVDDAGTPFLWVTTLKTSVRRPPP